MNDQAQSIRVSGSSIEAAIDAGLDQMGLTRDQVEVKIIQEPSRGVLGIGSREAIVHLTQILLSRREPVRPAPRVEPAAPEPAPIKPPDRAQVEKAPPQAAPTTPTEPTEDEILAIARDVLVDLLARMEVEATIEARVVKGRDAGEGTSLVLDLRGNDLGFLIGRKGETLAALQHVVRLIVNKEIQQRVNLLVDIGGYKSRRESALRKLALRVADQVTRRHRTIALEPMTAYERRIIHITLRNHPTVTTESVGERDHRKVTILPKS